MTVFLANAIVKTVLNALVLSALGLAPAVHDFQSMKLLFRPTNKEKQKEKSSTTWEE